MWHVVVASCCCSHYVVAPCCYCTRLGQSHNNISSPPFTRVVITLWSTALTITCCTANHSRSVNQSESSSISGAADDHHQGQRQDELKRNIQLFYWLFYWHAKYTVKQSLYVVKLSFYFNSDFTFSNEIYEDKDNVFQIFY